MNELEYTLSDGKVVRILVDDDFFPVQTELSLRVLDYATKRGDLTGNRVVKRQDPHTFRKKVAA